jgi:hypothetical protein
MFEQQLYNPEPVVTPLQHGDLFHGYEIKNWELSPRIYKILAAAAVVNILALVVFAQTSLLTMKGCDSPLVGRVCEVLDTVYVASTLWGTDRDYIDAVYEKTDLGDAEITFVDVSGITPPLSYPEGYFQLANPVEFQAMLDASADPFGTAGFPEYTPGFPASTPYTGGSLIDTEPVLPPANPNVIQGELPTFNNGSGVASNPRPRSSKRRGRVTSSTPDVDDMADAGEKDPMGTKIEDPKGIPGFPNQPSPSPSPTAANADDAKEDKFGVYINKRPLVDRATETVKKIEDKEVKLDAPFKVSIVGTLGMAKDGKTVVLKNPKPLPPEKGFRNDPRMEKLVQDWILAVGDAGWLGYLDIINEKQKRKPKKVTVTIEQTDAVLIAKIMSEEGSENEAKTLASSLGILLSGAAMAVDGDELTFLKSASTTFEGKSLVLNLNIPKPIVQEMIQRKLAATKAGPNKPSGNAGNPIPNTSAK